MPTGFKPCRCGVTVWLTGPPEAHTARLAHTVAERLRGAGQRVAVLNTDDTRRAGLTAEVLARNGVIVLVSSTLTPYTNNTHPVRQRHNNSGTHFLHIHLATPTTTPDPDPSQAHRNPHDADLLIQTPTPSTQKPATLILQLLTDKHFADATT